MDRAVELGMSAMALTDHGNLFGTISFIKQAEKARNKADYRLRRIYGYRS